ncbi:MAG: UDP-N-acetylglucosamine--N-acetylmuramyl-(pentapeptide) pyrophosphoryl-undecaprenol N-acetylglucosamine transferase [candidate division WOR-3 bacterium]
MVKIFIITGGTGGHIFPALEVKKFLESLNFKTYLLASLKDDTDFNINFDFKFDSAPFKGQNFKKIFLNIFKILKGTFQSFLFILKINPHMIFIFGSYASFPFFIPSLLMRKKIFVFEQNSIPGVVTKIFSKFSNKIFVSFKETEKFLRKKCILLSNPVRNLKLIPREEARRILNIPLDKRTILFLGGSQGAKKLIELSHKYSEITDDTILTLAGKFYEEYKEKLKRENFYLFPFRNDMENFYSACDVVVSRSGAGAVFEILKIKKKAIFIPFPYAADNHQHYNALFAKRYGTFKILIEEKVDPFILKKEIDEIFKEKENFKELPDWRKILKREIKSCYSCIQE